MAYTFNSRRSVVMALGGMVATGQPLAAAAGLRVLQEGGNAVDAAVTAAAVLAVVEPLSTGLGGDLAALLYRAETGEVRALNACGRAPRTPAPATPGKGRATAGSGLGVATPGALHGWAALLEAAGTWSLEQALAPAIRYAEQGFPVSELTGRQWAQSSSKLRSHPEAAASFLVEGKAPRIGQIFSRPDLARTLREIASGGPEVFYRGPLAARIAATVQEHGGSLTEDDLAADEASWEAPMEASYRGARVLVGPPGGLAPAVLEALSLLQGDELGAMNWGFAEPLHLQIEALKLALTAVAQQREPAQDGPLGRLYDPAYLAARRALIDPRRATPLAAPALPGPTADAACLTVVDHERNAVSLVQGLHEPFGAGLAVPGSGIVLQSQSALLPLAPGRRPPATLLPALILQGPHLLAGLAVTGGPMQVQGLVQVLCNLLDWGMDVQQALDAPRFRWLDGNTVAFETGLSHMSRLALEKLGVEVKPNAAPQTLGGGQIIRLDPESGVLQGGSDPRRDGCAVGY